MATDLTAPQIEDPSGERPTRSPARAGFFTVHKPNQGKVTRLATGAAAALLLALTAHFVYAQVRSYDGAFATVKEVPPTATQAQQLEIAQANAASLAASTQSVRYLAIGLGAAVLVFGGLLAWRLINKPANAEFLIATDSEMKKVSWTSRKDLIGSTKVVILFMFMIATILFVIDMLFHYLFYLITVLKFAPFGM